MAADRVEECVIAIHALPGAKKNEVLSAAPGLPVRIKVNAPPVEGKANQTLITFLHDVLNLRKSQIEIVGGLTSREKRVKITGLSEAEAFRMLNEQIKVK